MTYTPMAELDELIRMCPDQEEPVDPLHREAVARPAGRNERIRQLRARGVSAEDIARRVGLTPGGVRNALFRMRARSN